MSRLSGYPDPKLRATFEAVLMPPPALTPTTTPVIDTTPDAIDRDTRSQANTSTTTLARAAGARLR